MSWTLIKTAIFEHLNNAPDADGKPRLDVSPAVQPEIFDPLSPPNDENIVYPYIQIGVGQEENNPAIGLDEFDCVFDIMVIDRQDPNERTTARANLIADTVKERMRTLKTIPQLGASHIFYSNGFNETSPAVENASIMQVEITLTFKIIYVVANPV